MNYVQSERSTGGNTPIFPELVCGVGIRYLGGDALKTLGDVFGMSDLFIRAALLSDHPLLAINFPELEDDLNRTAAEWSPRSVSFRLLDGFLAAMDGCLALLHQQTRRCG